MKMAAKIFIESEKKCMISFAALEKRFVVLLLCNVSNESFQTYLFDSKIDAVF